MILPPANNKSFDVKPLFVARFRSCIKDRSVDSFT